MCVCTTGVKRKGKEELSEGNIDVSSSHSPYATKNILLAAKDFQKLMDLTSYNVVNNKEILKNVLKKALNKNGAC